jgi:hypothetical protein
MQSECPIRSEAATSSKPAPCLHQQTSFPLLAIQTKPNTRSLFPSFLVIYSGSTGPGSIHSGQPHLKVYTATGHPAPSPRLQNAAAARPLLTGAEAAAAGRRQRRVRADGVDGGVVGLELQSRQGADAEGGEVHPPYPAAHLPLLPPALPLLSRPISCW